MQTQCLADARFARCASVSSRYSECMHRWFPLWFPGLRLAFQKGHLTAKLGWRRWVRTTGFSLTCGNKAWRCPGVPGVVCTVVPASGSRSSLLTSRFKSELGPGARPAGDAPAGWPGLPYELRWTGGQAGGDSPNSGLARASPYRWCAATACSSILAPNGSAPAWKVSRDGVAARVRELAAPPVVDIAIVADVGEQHLHVENLV